eukprot:scaffold112796_cov62-Attheya_sp.AAC.4
MLIVNFYHSAIGARPLTEFELARAMRVAIWVRIDYLGDHQNLQPFHAHECPKFIKMGDNCQSRH